VVLGPRSGVDGDGRAADERVPGDVDGADREVLGAGAAGVEHDHGRFAARLALERVVGLRVPLRPARLPRPPLQVGQDVDFLEAGRAFREQTLRLADGAADVAALCRNGAAVDRVLHGLHVAGELRFEPPLGPAGEERDRFVLVLQAAEDGERGPLRRGVARLALVHGAHAVGVVDDDGDRGLGAKHARAFGQLDDELRERECEQDEEQGAEEEKQEVLDSAAVRGPFVADLEEADGGEEDLLRLPAVDEVEDERNARRQQPDQIDWREWHSVRSPMF